MMDRKLLITLHLYLAAFLAPAVLLVAISGGLYLAGVKGNVEETSIYRGSAVTLDPEASTLKADVARVLAEAGVQDYSFEYVKVSGNTLTTRPTSKHHYILKLHADAVEVIAARPSLQSRMIELHKGHGPTLFKTYQRPLAGDYCQKTAAPHAGYRGYWDTAVRAVDILIPPPLSALLKPGGIERLAIRR